MSNQILYIFDSRGSQHLMICKKEPVACAIFFFNVSGKLGNFLTSGPRHPFQRGPWTTIFYAFQHHKKGRNVRLIDLNCHALQVLCINFS